MYKNIYKKSLKNLVENLNSSINSLDTDIVIALSRKGPRLLEYLRLHYGLNSFPVVSEMALPFIIKKIKDNSDKKYRIFIVDDAIYFGSTIQNMYDEIMQYIQEYSLENVVVAKIFAAIKSKESKQLMVGETEICAESDIDSGYGHYFVKTLMQDLATLNESLEIEFPVVDYAIKDQEKTELLSYLKSVRPDIITYSTCRNGVNNLNILFNEDRFSSFNKLRTYETDNILKMVYMHPYYINNSESAIEGFMIGQYYCYKRIWDSIEMFMIPMKKELLYSSDLRRNWLRTKVVLANYLQSFSSIVGFVKDLEIRDLNKRFSKTCLSVDFSNLQYLVGEGLLVDIIKKNLEIVLEKGIELDNVFINSELSSEKDLFIERKSLPDEELDLLQSYNAAMVANSEKSFEALSAVFTNLTFLVEKWTRGTIFDNSYRLRFGYTFDNLKRIIRKYSRYNLEKNLNKKIHKWIDQNIDAGCIVPQYIIDIESDNWVRVFRPGENEDLLLSHLGRFVLHVWKKINKVTGIDKIPEDNLQAMLSVIIDQKKQILDEEEPSWELTIDEELKPCINKTNIVDYLVRMFIFKRENRNLSLSLRFSDKEFQENTTLSKEAIEEIDRLIDSLLPKDKIKENPLGDISIELNSELTKYFKLKVIEENISALCKQLNESILVRLLESDGLPTLSIEDRRSFNDNYLHKIKPYLLTDAKEKELYNQKEIQEIEKRLRNILTIYNILLVFFVFREDAYYKRLLSDAEFIRSIGMTDIIDYAEQLINGKQIDENTCKKLLLMLCDFITKM